MLVLDDQIANYWGRYETGKCEDVRKVPDVLVKDRRKGGAQAVGKRRSTKHCKDLVNVLCFQNGKANCLCS